MKDLITLTIIVMLLITAGCITGKHSESAGIVGIQDVRKTYEPEPDLTKHKHHDVEVYRTMDTGESYWVRFYRTERDSVKCYKVGWDGSDDMDQAAYEWLNDSSVFVRLYNTRSKKQITFKASGYTSGGIKSTTSTVGD